MKKNLLYERAKKIIPGGTSLFSKKPENILPNLWPTYFEKCKDINVWDLNKKKYKDFFFGVGQNTLGYCNQKIDREVIKVTLKGNMSSLNSFEEVRLAEKLIELHPWASMVKFARSGGEINSVAIRIARAASGRDNIAICGYHGWHDWYLSANLLNNKNLNNHHLTGLLIDGVPKKLANTVFPFKYNDFANLEKIVKEKNIGVIKMEVRREKEPENNFLNNVKKLCKKNGVVLIFDECTTGFRQSFGGLHKYYKVTPDLAIFGKALGNGYAITSVIGTKDVMKYAQNTFISSTFWTERIGYAAGLKTLEIMEKEKSWIKISNLGKYVKHLWKEIANDNNLEIKLSGIDALPSFNFIYKNNLAYRTYVTQEMLKKGFLATNVIYMSTKHEKKMIDKYIQELNKIFKQIKKFEEGLSIKKYLNTDVINPSFKRLTD